MEEYRIIQDFENYSISNLGNVINNKTGRRLKARINKEGYEYVNLYKDGKPKSCNVHRLVGKSFIPNPNEKQCIDHIDNNRANNTVTNLRWATYGENSQNLSISARNTSGIIGVRFDKKSKKWRAEIGINGKKIHIGIFNTIEEATIVRKKKANEIKGVFVNKLEKIRNELDELEAELEAL